MGERVIIRSFPQGYGVPIESPTTFHFTPMQARPREAEAHFRAAVAFAPVRGEAGGGAASDAVAANAARGLEASLGMQAETGPGYEARRRGRTKRGDRIRDR